MLPYRRLDLQSPLSVTEVSQVLSDSVGPKRWLRMGPGDRPFEGTVTSSGFHIQRTIGYRNSFLPQISGTVVPEGSGIRISITMKVHGTVVLVMVVWFGIVSSVCAGIGVAFVAGRVDDVGALAPFGMLLFAALMVIGAFSYEARKATKLLTSMFRANHALAPLPATGFS